MDFPEFKDVVSSEKDEALCKFPGTRKLGCLIRVAEAGCALLFLWYVSNDIDLAGCFLALKFRVLMTPLSAFLFGNGIVVVVFVLSGGRRNHHRQGADGVSKGNAALFRGSCEGRPLAEGIGMVESIILTSSDEEVNEIMIPTVAEVDVNEKPDIAKIPDMCGDSRQPKGETGLSGGNSSDNADNPIVRSEGVVRAARSEFRRSKSEEITTERPSSKELSRWATDNSGSATDWDLSNEEFNSKVEKYIARKKLLLREEATAERTAGKSEPA